MLDKSKYDQEYAKKNIVRKNIPFNKTVPDDVKILEWLKDRPEGMTAYIKKLILDDIEYQDSMESARKYAEESATKAAQKCIEAELTFPAIDGYCNEEACKVCLEQEHNIYAHRQGPWEVRIDTDAMKVLTVRAWPPILTLD